MTIAIQDVPFRNLYTATAAQVVFTVSFPFMSDTYLAVYQRAAADEPDNITQLLVLGVDYTVTGTGSETGGSITLTNPATAGDIIAILSVEPIDRTSVFNDLNSFTVTLNQQLNDLTIMVKQMDTVINQLIPKYRIDELVSATVRPEKLELPILNDGQTWVGQGDLGDSPDNIIAATAFPEELLEVDFVIGTADANLPNAQVLGSLGSGFMANVDGGATGTLVSRTFSNTANQTTLTNGTGAGNVVVGLADNLIMPGTEGSEFPKGTTAQRPGGPADGVTRWNTDLDTWEGWDGATWVDFFTTSTGANINLSNLSATAINTSLISDTDATDNLGSQAIRWANIYATTLQTGDTAGDLLRIGAWDTNGASFTPFITITANNTPTCVLADGVEGVTQAPGDSSDLLATTQYVDDAVSSAGANTALSNLAAVAINESLISDSDGLDDLGSPTNRWLHLYSERITTGETAADTLNIGAWDVNGGVFVPFITLTANNTPTCLLQDGVEAITQLPGDNSTLVATTEYCEDYLPLAGGTMTGDLILNADPTVALGAVTKQYVDAIAAGIDIKDPAYAATTGALTATYLNGASGVGATLTNSGAQAAFSVDGVSPPITSRILVKNQGSSFENGIYTLTVVGTGATNWVLTRATDYDQVAEISTGDLVIVENGTANAVTSWLQTATVATIGVDAITFAQFSGAASGANTALSNLAAVAINTSLISDTDITDDLGSLAIRWKDIFAQTLNTGDTATDTLKLRGYDVDGAAFVDFLTITANNTPTAVLNGDVTSTTQAFADSSTKLATTAFTQAARKQVVNAQTLTYTALASDLGKVILYTGAGGVDLALTAAATLADGWFTTLRNDSAGTITINPNGAETINGAATLAVAAGDGVIIYTNGTLFYTVGEASASSGANTALSNLAAVAINTTLVSDTDVTDNLGTQAIRWNNIYAASLQTGDTAADVLNIGAWDVDGAAISNFITLTAGNTPTCALASGVTAVTQSASDNSTKLATTAYVDTAVTAAGSLVYISAATASSSATLDFTANINSTYESYIFIITGLTVATNAVELWIRTSTNAGSSWSSGASDYTWTFGEFGSGGGSDTADAQIKLFNTTYPIANTAGASYGGSVLLSDPSSASLWKNFSWSGGYYNSSAGYQSVNNGAGIYKATTAITGVRFMASSGNLAVGKIAMYGVKNS